MKKYKVQLLEWLREPHERNRLRAGITRVVHETTIEDKNFSYAQNQALAFYGSDGRGTIKSTNHYKFKIRVTEIDS